MLRRMIARLRALPHNPFRLARALVASPKIVPPLHRVERHGPRTAHDLEQWTADYPVLILHGRDNIATGLHALLRRHRWRSLIVREVAAAEAILRAAPVSLIILDFGLFDAGSLGLFYHDTFRALGGVMPPVVLWVAAEFLPVPEAVRENPDLVVYTMPFGQTEFAVVVGRTLLERAHWRTPPGYHPDRAQRVLAEHVYAR